MLENFVIKIHIHILFVKTSNIFQLVVVQVISSLECAPILLSCKFHVASWNMGDDLFTFFVSGTKLGFSCR